MNYSVLKLSAIISFEIMKSDAQPPAKRRNNIPFLMNQIVSRVRAESTIEFRQLGFNQQSARVMIVALQNPGISVKALSGITTIKLSTLSYMLTRLSRKRLLERRRDERDTRYLTIYLTGEGERLAIDCKKSSDERERRMLKGFSQTEISELRVMLSRIFDTVRSEGWTKELDEAQHRVLGTNGKVARRRTALKPR